MKPASLRTLWLLYAAFILYAGTIPFHFQVSPGDAAARLPALLSNPFASPETGRGLSIPDVVQNILLFVPFGALGLAAGTNALRWTWRRIGWITALGAGLSLCVELTQLFMKDRVASTTDVMTNTGGTLAGAVATLLGGQLAGRAVARLKAEGLAGVPEIKPLAVASAILAIAFLQPFDVTLELGTIVGHLRLFASNPLQLTGLRDEGLILLLATLFSMALCSYVIALGERAAARKSAVIGVGAVLALEACQLGLTSRMPGVWDAVVGSAGVLIGAGLWALSNRVEWPGLWRTFLVLMTVAAAGLLMLSPFEWAPQHRGFNWYPFLGYYTRTTFETLSHVIELALAYFPLGFCLVFGSQSPRKATMQALTLTLVIAGVVEYLQGWVIGRYPDVSDVALSLAGSWFGARIGRTIS